MYLDVPENTGLLISIPKSTIISTAIGGAATMRLILFVRDFSRYRRMA
jgi:hypothetical protein